MSCAYSTLWCVERITQRAVCCAHSALDYNWAFSPFLVSNQTNPNLSELCVIGR